MIDWKEGAACLVFDHQWREGDKLPAEYGGGVVSADLVQFIEVKGFQLNEILKGDYIESSELDTEQKYNNAVEVFGLFGAKWGLESCTELSDLDEGDILIWSSTLDQGASWHIQRKRKLTYPQLMAIGKLKRAMIERERAVMVDKIKAPKPVTKADACNELGVPIPFKPKRNKSKQAYDILKALDYEYDLVKQRWYKKAYI